MSEIDQAQQGPDQSQSADTGKQFTPEQLQARLHAVNEEAKKYRQNNSQLKDELEKLKSEKLKLEGNKDELIKTLETELTSTKSKQKEMFQNLAYKTVSSAIQLEAQKYGCQDMDVLLKVVDYTKLEVKDDFSVDDEGIKLQVQEILKSKPYLFQKKEVEIHDGTPGTDTAQGGIPKFKNQQDFEAYLKQKGLM